MVHGITGERGAYRRSYSDRSSDGSEREVEPSAAAHDIGNDQRDKNPEHRSRYAVERLHCDHNAGFPFDCKQRATHRQCRKTQKQWGPSAP